MFSFNPTRAQAHTTNAITVTVTDNGLPPLSDSKSFTVVVNDYLELFLGSTILRVGETGSVPVTFFSSTPITNLDFAIDFPAGRLTNWAIQSFLHFAASGFVSNNSHLLISFALTNGQSFVGSQSLGQLDFTAVSPQISAFLDLSFSDTTGLREDGTVIPKNLFNGGIATVIGAESLLRAFVGTNGHRSLILYGSPGSTHTIQLSTSLVPTVWQNVSLHTLTNFTELINLGDTSPAAFYRAKQ